MHTKHADALLGSSGPTSTTCCSVEHNVIGAMLMSHSGPVFHCVCVLVVHHIALRDGGSRGHYEDDDGRPEHSCVVYKHHGQGVVLAKWWVQPNNELVPRRQASCIRQSCQVAETFTPSVSVWSRKIAVM